MVNRTPSLWLPELTPWCLEPALVSMAHGYDQSSRHGTKLEIVLCNHIALHFITIHANRVYQLITSGKTPCS